MGKNIEEKPDSKQINEPNQVDYNENKSFYALSPQNDIKPETAQTYFDALLWALTNRGKKNIRNIAITGIYGSGKSSVISTFQKQNIKKKDWHFLPISLATFSNSIEEKSDTGQEEEQTTTENNDKNKSKPKNNTENLQRLIELSILQQLLYREKDRALPDSRIRKIKRHTGKRVFFSAIGIFIFIISLANVITGYKHSLWFTFIQNILHHQVIIDSISMYFISLLISAIGSLFLLEIIVRFIYSIKLNKLSFQNAEIEVDEGISKSVLNHYLDEILYFFEATKYNIVVFEDLDRFDQTAVFTKLREINLLLNESKKIKAVRGENDSIVFIYAIRDDMFQENKERAKFFDFIIPIIPIINTSNSSDFLSTARDEKVIDISDNVIDDLSLFIDDTRLLYNIINEYKVYRANLNDKLDKNKLFAILFYKSLYPKDFSDLCANEGVLHSEIIRKQEIIHQRNDEINVKIEEIRNEITVLETITIKNIDELRKLYIYEYIKSLRNLVSFYINNINCPIDDAIKESNFQSFVNNTAQYNTLQQNYLQIPIKFDNVEKNVDSKYTYDKRQKQIEELNAKYTDELRKKIEQYENEKLVIRRKPLAEVYRAINDDSTSKDIQHKLITVLIENGYVDEDYFDYVSRFHEGSITKKDADFIINIKTGAAMGFDYPLEKIESVIHKLQKRDDGYFGKPSILNYNILNFILSNAGYDDEKKQIFSLLSDCSKRSIDFINTFIKKSNNVIDFIDTLCNTWKDFWKYINTKSDYSEDKKSEYFTMIIKYASIDNIVRQNKEKNITNTIENKKDYFSIIPDNDKLQLLITQLNIKFYSLNIETLNDTLFDFICRENHYQINCDMLTLILTYRNKYDQNQFNTQNFLAILNSDYQPLIDYINTYIETYIDDVYLKLSDNTNEPEEVLLQLLNNKTIPIDKKVLIIQKVSTKLTTLDSIDDIEVKRILIEELKITPSWATIIKLFHEENDEITDTILSFIDNHENADVISKTKIDREVPDKETVNKYILIMLTNNNISDEVYALITKSIPYWYSSLDLDNLSSNKIISLIDNTVLQVSNNNVSKLKSIFAPQHIRLLVKYPDELLKHFDTLTLDVSDYTELFKSSTLSVENKQKIYEKIVETDIVSNVELLNAIAVLVSGNVSFVVTDTVLKAVLLQSNIQSQSKIAIFNINAGKYLDDFITPFLQSLGLPYSDIAVHGYRPKLINNDTNKKFASILEAKGYISTQVDEGDMIRINTKRG